MPTHDPHRQAAAIVSDAGGKLVGRTRLQKVAYLSHLAGFSEDFEFKYRYYGPYSEGLASAMEIACAFGLVKEDKYVAEWGGQYSVYQSTVSGGVPDNEARAGFITAAAAVDPVLLELAATAAYLYVQEGIGDWADGDPWEETKRRKPDKATEERLLRAKEEYKVLLGFDTPAQLPPII